MNVDDIAVGSKYKIDAPGARRGSYEVRGIRQNKLGNTEITVKHVLDAHSRTITPENIIENFKPKAESKAQRIVSQELKVIAELDGVQIILEDVSYWPNWKTRGRKKITA